MADSAIKLDRERIRDLFDLRRRGGGTYGAYTDDPNPGLHELRETGPVHQGVPHELLGFDGFAAFSGLPEPDRPHFTVFNFEGCDRVFRDGETFVTQLEPVRTDERGMFNSILGMRGTQHRRYRALVQPAFVPNKAKWWIQNWIHDTVHGLIDGFEADGRADLNVDFDAAIPVLTITGSFGLPVEDALTIREALDGVGMVTGIDTLVAYLDPIIAARREEPQDDLISILCQESVKDEDGTTHRLTDDEIISFSHLLLAAGSGTTWKQLGITLTALLTHPEALDALREDRSLLGAAIEESVRWCPTDPMFARYVTRDSEVEGVPVPEGAVVHLEMGAANRDPQRWVDPDAYDIFREPKPTLAFGGGAHICLGMHVARAEMQTAIDALVSRLPNLRLDPDAEPPRLIGMYERGPTEVPVVWG